MVASSPTPLFPSGGTDKVSTRERCACFRETAYAFFLSCVVITNQYGRPGRSSSNWGIDTIEGYLEDSELVYVVHWIVLMAIALMMTL